MRILIAVDDSEFSAAAVEEVLRRDWGSGIECRLVTVAEPIIFGVVDPMYAVSVAEAEKEHITWLRKMVEREVERIKEALACPVTGVVLQGGVADSIIEEAASWKADLIVVGSHGRMGFQRFVLGSVSEKVVIGAPCSVEVVKIKKSGASSKESARKSDSVESIPC
ncbi:MAG: universal stress protein [Cyanobacteria bacterium]|nr:universal stress protein [Cyanobacteriota bacterium]